MAFDKATVYRVLESPDDTSPLTRGVRFFILSLVFLNVLAVVLETVKEIDAELSGFFLGFEIFSVAVFTVEYILRMWCITEDPDYPRRVTGRLRFAFTPLALVDLLAVAPFYLPMFISVDLRFLRTLRLIRIFRIFKAGRYSKSMQILARVVRAKREELIISFFILSLALVVAASLLYVAENEAQPEAFSSIPESLWWAVATLTTVGYGDVYPITDLGQFLGGIIAVFGVVMIALPTGILGAGFVEEHRRQEGEEKCPHCGEKLPR